MEIDKEVQKNPAGPALVIGIIAILDAIFGSMLFGIIGSAVGIILGIIAVMRSFKARRATRGAQGAGGFYTGMVAILLAVLFGFGCIALSNGLKNLAREHHTPLIESISESARYGLMGLSVRTKRADFSQADLDREAEILQAALVGKSAPAAESAPANAPESAPASTPQSAAEPAA